MLRIDWRHARTLFLSAFMGGLLACDSQPDAQKGATTSTEQQAALAAATQGGRVADAEAMLREFLEGSLETTSPPIETNALMACVPDGQTDRYLSLARYRVLESVLRGDSTDASAEVVSVAEETGHPRVANKYLTTVRIRIDTLHWVMTRARGSGRWGVCGYSKEGFGFGHYGTDRLTEWHPATSSWARVRQVAESLHTAR